MSQKAQSKSQVRVFADEEEKVEMKDCTEACIEHIKAFLAKINHSKRNSVLDAGCGDGRVIVNLLAERYSIVDGFDIDPGAVKIVKNNTTALLNVRNVECSSMENYQFIE